MKNIFLVIILLIGNLAHAQLIGSARRGVSGSGPSSVSETDPTVSAAIKAITSANITSWNALVGNVVATSGNQSTLAGTKAWTGVHAFGAGITSTIIQTGAVATGTRIQQTAPSNVFAQFQPTTGNVVFQSPGAAISDNGHRLTVSGTSSLAGNVNVSGSIIASGTISADAPTSDTHLVTRGFVSSPYTLKSATSYTLTLADAYTTIGLNIGTFATVYVPINSDIPIPINAEIKIIQMGAGAVTIGFGEGVSVRSVDEKKKSSGLYSVIILKKISTDEWLLYGDLIL